MDIFNKYAALKEADTIPVICSDCGQPQDLQTSDEDVLGALMTASYIFKLQTEIALLLRVEALFVRFSASRHPMKIRVEFNDKEERKNTQADPEFEKALAEDPEIREHLTHSGFWLPARLSSIQGAVEQWQRELNRDIIRCTSCGEGHYRIEPDFFDRLW